MSTQNKIAWLVSSLISLTSISVFAHDGGHDQGNYQVSKHWRDLSSGKTLIGKSHGEIDVAKDGTFYLSLMSTPQIKGGLHLYSAQGKKVGEVENAPDDFHGFVIHQDPNGKEYLYGASLRHKKLIKMTLDGEIILEVDAANAIPGKYHLAQTNDVSSSKLKLTAIDVDQDGNMYVVDGYNLDYIHKFNQSGQYISTFGGQDSPYKFNTCHKIRIDPRYTPNRLLCTDRSNGRIVHMTLNGALIGDYARNLRRPSAVDFFGDIAAVAEISGRVSLLDRAGNTVDTLGTNDNKDEINTNVSKPHQWQEGVFTAPHGITFDHQGNLFVTEWNKTGRIVRFDLTQN